MRVTVKETLSKYCPLGMADPNADSPMPLCLGPSCMAWRWGPVQENRVRIVAQQKALREPPRPDHIPPSWLFVPYDPVEELPANWLEPDEEAAARRQGYCGLAGEARHD